MKHSLRSILFGPIMALLFSGAAIADACSLSRNVQDVVAAATEASQRPTPQTIRALEKALAALDARQRQLGAFVLTPPLVQRYVSVQRGFVITYHMNGVSAAHGFATEPPHLELAAAVHSLFNANACAAAVALTPDGRPDETRALSDRSQDPETGHDLPPAREASDLSQLAARLKSPIALVPLLFVAALFGGALYLSIRRRRRGKARFICYLPAELSTNSERYDTHVLELSRSGAKISVRSQVKQGTHIMIALDGALLAASAVWSNASCMGVKFDDELSQRHFSDLLGSAGGGYESETAFA